MVQTRVVTLFGRLLESTQPGRVVIDVEPKMGDAKEFGLAGQIKLLDRQCSEVNYGHRYDIVRLPEHIARSLMQRPKRKGKGR